MSALKPAKRLAHACERVISHKLTSDGQLRATGDELQKFAALGWSVLAHDLEKISNRLAVQVVTMIRLHGIHQSCENY